MVLVIVYVPIPLDVKSITPVEEFIIRPNGENVNVPIVPVIVGDGFALP